MNTVTNQLFSLSFFEKAVAFSLPDTLLCLAAAALLGLFIAALYRVTKGDGGECFLTGTIHVGRESDAAAMEKVFRCLEECGVLVTEVEISQVAETGVASLLQAARYFLPLWESLEDRLGKETVAAVAAIFYNSSQDAVESTERSSPLTDWINSILSGFPIPFSVTLLRARSHISACISTAVKFAP